MGVAAKRLGKHAVGIANSIVNFLVIVIVLLLVAFSGYALWDSNQLHNAASSSTYEIFKPTVEGESESFEELCAINPEVFSWLTVYGTSIDYPVTQGEDNLKYVNTDAKGEYAVSGAIYLDYENSRDFTDFNSIMYGHHMEKNAMFGNIGLFSDREFFDARQYGNLYVDGKNYGIEFFLFMHVDAYDYSVYAPGIAGEEMCQAYLDNLQEKAKFTRDIDVTTEDRLVLLSTCSSASTNGRDVLVGRLTDEVYDDTFIANETDNQGIFARVDAQKGEWWERIPVWLWGGILAILVLLILAFVLVNKRKKKPQKEQYQHIVSNQSRLQLVYRKSPPTAGGDIPENTEDR